MEKQQTTETKKHAKTTGPDVLGDTDQLKKDDYVWSHSIFEMPRMSHESFLLNIEKFKVSLAAQSCTIKEEKAPQHEYKEWEETLRRQKEGKIPSGQDFVYKEPLCNYVISMPGVNGTMFIKRSTHEARIHCTLGPISETLNECDQLEQVVSPFYEAMDKCNVWHEYMKELRVRVVIKIATDWSVNFFRCIRPRKIDLEKWFNSHYAADDTGKKNWESRRGLSVAKILAQNPVDGKTVVLDDKYWTQKQKNTYEYCKIHMIPSQLELFKAYSSVLGMPFYKPNMLQCREAKPEYLHEMWSDNIYGLHWGCGERGQCLIMTELIHSKFEIHIYDNGHVIFKTFVGSIIDTLWPRLLAELKGREPPF